MKLKKLLFIAILFLGLAGCGGVNEISLEKVLEKDPSFGKLLAAKKRINTKIAALSEEIRSVRQTLEPKIDALKAKLDEARSEAKTKSLELKESLSKSKNIKKLLIKKKDLSLSGDEVSIWNKRSVDLQNRIDSLKRDLVELQNKAHLLKTEIQILED